MKACLMKVNYDPKYMNPHSNPPNNLQNKNDLPFVRMPQTRLNISKNIYKSPDKTGQQRSLGVKQRTQLSAPDFAFRSHNRGADSPEKLHKPKPPKEPKDSSKDRTSNSRNAGSPESPATSPGPTKAPKSEQHRSGVARAHASVKLQPLKESASINRLSVPDGPVWRNNTGDQHKHGPYAEKLPRRHLTQSNFTLFNSQRKPTTLTTIKSMDSGSREHTAVPLIQRSQTLPPNERIRVRSIAIIELERRAKIAAEKAMRENKVFCIHGPYATLRHDLRKRGWVEKFNIPSQSESNKKKSPVLSSDSDNRAKEGSGEKRSSKKENKIQPWDEENGYYGMMSYHVRNCTPTFVFSVKSSSIDTKSTKLGQLVNHFGKAANFTTKTGLCLNLRSVPWYHMTDPDTFYPRCYKLNEPDDKEMFYDDYHRTLCISFLKSYVQRYTDPKNIPKMSDDSTGPGIRFPRMPLVTVKALEIAIEQCERFLRCHGHDDIDDLYETDIMADCQWEDFRSWYRLFVHEACDLSSVSVAMVAECHRLLESVEAIWPQFHVDGIRNVWILKPGAKSRGRGIHCQDKYEDIMRAADTTDGSLVIQKYIERPLLIYNTKFDIRQWFLVTDWNPLTIWFYKDSYLRFCSQEYTLLDFDPAIHLSNNYVQKHLKNGPRSDRLPEDNTWTSDEFQKYLSEEKGEKYIWDKTVVEGMKNAIVCSLLCTQEFIEYKKGAFELYGADFMLTEDFRPWLLEINCSPSMSQNTHATKPLVTNVLEDTLKVVLDRRLDKNCDTGGFQLAYQQSVIHDPPPLDSTLLVQGKRVKQPHSKSPRKEASSGAISAASQQKDSKASR